MGDLSALRAAAPPAARGAGIESAGGSESSSSSAGQCRPPPSRTRRSLPYSAPVEAEGSEPTSSEHVETTGHEYSDGALANVLPHRRRDNVIQRATCHQNVHQNIH